MAEAIAVVDSTKNGVIHVTIREQAKTHDIEGGLCELVLEGDSYKQSVLARLGVVDCMNVFHENSNFSPLISALGKVPHFSGVADVYSSQLTEIACVDVASDKLTPRLSPPPSGTQVSILQPGNIDRYLNDKESYLTVGHLPNYPDIPMTCINRDFSSIDRGGYGEAKHSIIFGQNGSGKTVFATTLIAGKLVANPTMGCLIPDTAGDISLEGSHIKGGEFQYDFIRLLNEGGREYELIDIADVRLKHKSTFKRCLVPLLRSEFSMNGEKAASLSDKITESIFGREVEIEKASAKKILEVAYEEVSESGLYTKATRQDKADDISRLMGNPNRVEAFAEKYHDTVAKHFEGEYRIDWLINKFLKDGRIVLLQLHTLGIDDQRFVMAEIFKIAKMNTEIAYKQTGAMVNSLIVLDEGPRWVPQDKDRDDEVASIIIDAFNTTRKYGIGWTVISQRITAIDKNVLAQCHTRWVGRGVGIGADRKNMESFLGDQGVKAYDRLQRQGGYFWIGSGHEVNFGTGDQFMTLITFGGDSTQEIMDRNPEIWKGF